ncbi:MAG: hypothetical protein ACO1RT_07740 [Planctomycetaceae bacterium]
MFGFRRAKTTESIQWRTVLPLLEDDDRRAPLIRTYPTQGRESFLGALSRIDPQVEDAVRSAGKQLHWASEVVNYPTVAIAGMLNSGKTSLVATFLSEAGRRRTLRGTGNAEGTHRFVLWLPEKWKMDQECFGMLISRIGDALGSAPEMLATDPAEAHRQYNNAAKSMAASSVPLIATDVGLDQAGIALLDCPDIVSDAAFGLGSPEQRRDLLGRSSTLCSSFIVVAAPEQSRDATLSELLRIASEKMPGVPRILAINKVRAKNQTPVQVHETFLPLIERHGISKLYAAYDFDVDNCRPYIPRDLQNATAHPLPSDDELPVFFSVSPEADQNPPAAIGSDRLLASLPAQLDRSKLSEQFQLALESRLRTVVWDEGFRKLRDDTQRLAADSEAARKALLQTALDFFAVEDANSGTIRELRLHQSERILRQLSESFAATAPWYARWNVRMHATIKRVFGGAGDFLRQLLPTAQMQSAAARIKQDIKDGAVGGLVTPARLRNTAKDHFVLTAWKEDAPWLDEACEAAIHRYERDDFTSLDPRRLDAACREMWAQLGTTEKVKAGLTPLAMLLATVGGVLMIPVDFGTTVVASASIAELLAAAGLTALSAHWAGRQSIESVGQQAARQQLSDFHAVLCDTFGISRGESPMTVFIRGVQVVLPKPTILHRDPIAPPLPTFQLQPGFESELRQVLPPP